MSTTSALPFSRSLRSIRVDGSRGSETRGYLAAESDLVSRMHGHGYATLALAQAYAQSPRSKRGANAGRLCSSSHGPSSANSCFVSIWRG